MIAVLFYTKASDGFWYLSDLDAGVTSCQVPVKVFMFSSEGELAIFCEKLSAKDNTYKLLRLDLREVSVETKLNFSYFEAKKG